MSIARSHLIWQAQSGKNTRRCERLAPSRISSSQLPSSPNEFFPSVSSREPSSSFRNSRENSHSRPSVSTLSTFVRSPEVDRRIIIGGFSAALSSTLVPPPALSNFPLEQRRTLTATIANACVNVPLYFCFAVERLFPFLRLVTVVRLLKLIQASTRSTLFFYFPTTCSNRFSGRKYGGARRLIGRMERGEFWEIARVFNVRAKCFNYATRSRSVGRGSFLFLPNFLPSWN